MTRAEFIAWLTFEVGGIFELADFTGRTDGISLQFEDGTELEVRVN